jgi:hypothetical protein
VIAVVSSLLFALSSVCSACGDDAPGADDEQHDRGRDELSDFIAVAEDADCADDMNRIYRIDGEQVLWHREDLACADAAYAIALYGPTPDDELCSSFQTIAGPVTECSDVREQAEFETIIDNLQAPDLGLGEEHTLELVWDASD